MDIALDLLRAAERVLITGHLRADGDCLGAESVLYHTCVALGKEVTILNPDAPDPRYGFFEEHTPFSVYQADMALPPCDLAIICDCSMISRVGRVGELLQERGIPCIVLDHHVFDGDPTEWAAMVHDDSAAASGQLAVEVADALGVDLPLGALEAAFAALATDTGWFKFSNSDARAYSMAASLVARGVKPDHIFQLVYQSADPGRPLGIAAALSRVVYHADGRLAVVALSQDELRAAGGTLVDTDEVLDLLRSVDVVEGVLFLTERGDFVKASLRSKTDSFDVNRIASTLGGGGHRRAAGVNFDAGVSLESATEQTLAAALAAMSR